MRLIEGLAQYLAVHQARKLEWVIPELDVVMLVGDLTTQSQNHISKMPRSAS